MCVKSARTDLCGGRSAMAVPTATMVSVPVVRSPAARVLDVKTMFVHPGRPLRKLQAAMNFSRVILIWLFRHVFSNGP